MKQTNLDSHCINLAEAFSSEPPPLDFVLPGYLAGTVGILASPGAAGKTWLALELCCAVASPAANKRLLGLPLVKHGQAVFLSAEDPESALRHRLHSIGKYLDGDAIAELQSNFRVASLVGLSTDLHPCPQSHGDSDFEDWSQTLGEQCAGARLIVLDTLSRWHSRDENTNGEMVQVIKKTEAIANVTGASLLFLHHANKGMVMAGRGDEQQSARGASAIVDNARWQSALVAMSPEEEKTYGLTSKPGERGRHRRLVVNKQNHGEPVETIWLRRGEGGVLLRTELQDVTPASTPKATRGGGYNGKM